MLQIREKLPVAILIGRENVGKSTIFNRLVKGKKALITNMPGTTRDVVSGRVEWCSKKFILVDTGGLNPTKKTIIQSEITKQVEKFIKKANIILFVVDTKHGLHPLDKTLYKDLVKKYNKTKKIIILANKCDSSNTRNQVSDFLKLSAKTKILPMSAINGSGCGDALDEIIYEFDNKINIINPESTPIEQKIKIALIGLPNVGKSSILNKLAGDYLSIVSSKPHTTQNPQTFQIQFQNRLIEFMDTAGIRKRNKITATIEQHSVKMSLKAIKNSDIAVLVVDISKGADNQDMKLSKLIEKYKKPSIILVNKWDKIDNKDSKTIISHQKYITKMFSSLPYAKILFVSAKTGQRISNLVPTILQVNTAFKRNIEREDLNDFYYHFANSLRKKLNPPENAKLRQVYSSPPTFILKMNKKQRLNPAYLNLLKKSLRDKFDFWGVPIIISTDRTPIKIKKN